MVRTVTAWRRLRRKILKYSRRRNGIALIHEWVAAAFAAKSALEVGIFFRSRHKASVDRRDKPALPRSTIPATREPATTEALRIERAEQTKRRSRCGRLVRIETLSWYAMKSTPCSVALEDAGNGMCPANTGGLGAS